ncbi:MAG: hypothetical protein IT209_07030 [Armatimonadetes bacterium]|nr:hypothetical protein [Armatimonadota bacterium]
MPYTGDPDLPVRRTEEWFLAIVTGCMIVVILVGIVGFMRAHDTAGMAGPTMAPQLGIGVDVSRGTAAVGSSRSGSSPFSERGAVSYGSWQEPRHVPEGGIDLSNARRGTGAGPSGCYANPKLDKGAVDIGPSQIEQTIKQLSI